MKKPGRAAGPQTSSSRTRAPSSLVSRLLGSLQRRALASNLPPPGQRSGEGADSLGPYLEQGRSTRPSPLE
jgi:hypothetical protein